MALLGWLLALLSGCTSTRALCPLEGGRPWVEVRSPHFSVRTNLDTPTAEAAAQELEMLRQGLLQAWGGNFDPPGTVDIILLHNRSALEEFTNIRIEGFSTRTEDGPLLVLAGHAYALTEATADVTTQAHELTHYLSELALVRQPRWLSEGLAGYLETIALRPERREVILGRLHDAFYTQVSRHGWRTLDELWEWERKGMLSTAESRQYYASSWLWVHFFITRHSTRFEAFQKRLMRGEHPRQAFDAAFQGAKDLSGELNGYVRHHGHVNYRTTTAPLSPVKCLLTTRPLRAAEVHALRAQLFLMTPGAAPMEARLPHMEREMAEATREEPGNVDVMLLRLRSTEDPFRRLALARELLAMHPVSGHAWMALAQALDAAGYTSEEQEAARRRAVELLPDSVSAQNGLAGYYARTAQPEKGLAAAQRALTLAPGNASVLDTWSTILFQLGRCPEALEAQHLAVDMLHEGTPQRLRRTVNDTLARYQAVCGETSPAGGEHLPMAAPASQAP
ncbi:TPR domain protein [Myxococcus hansupus]|uniref:TPR domain protein n=1 Tax=Pseudomyxococcus hansupus TaxID=1297742 RepID=A0A0H4X1D5_9BACT|nr:TPR domain protein [Myxococcus hansupus]